MHVPQSLRAYVLPLMMGAPAVIAAVWIVAIEGYRMIAPDAFLFTEPPAPSFADSLHHREVELSYAFVRAGQDPNEAIAFRDATLTDGRVVELSPLMLAVAARNRNAVMMLLSNGVRVDLPRNALAACLARDIGEADLERMILSSGPAQSTLTCPEPNGVREAPLLTYVETRTH
jgi:hypothetical protein